jgi:hypothetical protein
MCSELRFKYRCGCRQTEKNKNPCPSIKDGGACTALDTVDNETAFKDSDCIDCIVARTAASQAAADESMRVARDYVKKRQAMDSASRDRASEESD